MVVTILDATVAEDREQVLVEAYEAAAAGTLPAGLISSKLLRDAQDPRRWRIETRWADREAVEAMRAAGTPRGILMFRAAGAEPSFAMFEVVAAISP